MLVFDFDFWNTENTFLSRTKDLYHFEMNELDGFTAFLRSRKKVIRAFSDKDFSKVFIPILNFITPWLIDGL